MLTCFNPGLTGHPARTKRQGKTLWSDLPLVAILILLALLGKDARAQIEPAPFYRNGEPFFPIGLYHCPGSNCDTPEVLAEIGQAGFNCVRWNIGSITPASLDTAHAHGVGVFAAAGSWLGNLQKYQDELEAKVNQIKDHPALVAYETRDEPYWNYYHYQRGFSREDLTAGCNFVNQLDPDHQVWCNFAPYDLTTNADDRPLTFEGYVEWTSVGNIFGMDRYPVWGNAYPDENLNPVNFNCDQVRAIANAGAGEGTTIYMVLQGVGMLEWDDDPANDGRRPNYTETRFMGYSSIIHGARGILYWGQRYIEPDSQLWTDLKRFAGELEVLEDVLSAGTTGPDVQSSEGIETILKEYKGHRYLIAANRTSSTQSGITLSLAGWPSPVARVLFEDRMVSSQSAQIVDDFEPWGVHVYLDSVPGDFDFDGDVDQDDFGRFQSCFSGPGVPQSNPGCMPALLDDDQDVDEADFSIFRKCISGPDILADSDCADS